MGLFIYSESMKIDELDKSNIMAVQNRLIFSEI